MSTENRVLLAQILGLLAIVAARFGIDITTEQQANLLAGLSTFGLLFTAVLAKFRATDGSGKQQGYATPGLLGALALAGVIALCSACASRQPIYSEDALALGYTAHSALTRSVTAATRSHVITVEEAVLARASLGQSLAELDRARELIAVSKPAETELQQASRLLDEVHNQLPEELTDVGD